jgi:hypothetical protein
VTHDVTPEVTPVTASQAQRHLPILQAMPAAAGAHAPSPPPVSQTQPTTQANATAWDAGKKAPKLTPLERQIAEQLWTRYAQDFEERYNAPPLRDGRVNYQLAALTRSLRERAPDVAAHYLRSNHDWYVKKAHDLGTLLADASKVRAEMLAAEKNAARLAEIARKNHQPVSGGPMPVAAPEVVRAALGSLRQKWTQTRSTGT